MTYSVEQSVKTQHIENDILGEKDVYEWQSITGDFASFEAAKAFAVSHEDYKQSDCSGFRVTDGVAIWCV